jgi:hypothetical protein
MLGYVEVAPRLPAAIYGQTGYNKTIVLAANAGNAVSDHPLPASSEKALARRQAAVGIHRAAADKYFAWEALAGADFRSW